jgi:hypothetical protein
MSKNELQSLKERLANLNAPKSGHQRGPAEAGHGREAERPTEIPAVGWKDILLRSWGEVLQANLFLVAGGVTYAVLLALFPGLAALVSIYGLLMDPSQIEKQVSSLTGILPEQASAANAFRGTAHARHVVDGGAGAAERDPCTADCVVERLPRHERADHGAQHRLRGTGEAGLF